MQQTSQSSPVTAPTQRELLIVLERVEPILFATADPEVHSKAKDLLRRVRSEEPEAAIAQG
jgi:hypothetical protein